MKNFVFFVFGIVFYVFFASCSGKANVQTNDANREITDSTIKKPFGSFSLPNDWVELTQYSKNGKYFYSHKSEKGDSDITNISIEAGRNRYALEDHTAFRDAIVRQLATWGGDAQINGSGTFTKNNYPLYIFTILEEEPHVTTIQYYIVGDKKYILIHLTDFHNGNISNAEEVAKKMVESFSWAE
jgi:hypothetical protein